MVEPSTLPRPVARAAEALAAATDPGVRALAAFDLAHAAIRYVALVRLAAWWRHEPAPIAGHGDLVDKLKPALWGVRGAGPFAWWKVDRLLEPLASELPSTPGLARLTQRQLEQLDTVRRSRHAGTLVDVTAQLSSAATGTSLALVAAAAQILELPLTSPWLVVAEIDGVSDVLMFERDTTTLPIFGNHAALVPLDHGRDALAALHAWIDEVARAHADERLASLSHDALRSGLDAAARRAAGPALIAVDVEIKRPEIDQALSRLAPESVCVQVLVGTGGVGKSHALRRLIAASHRAVLWLRAVHWNGEPLDALLGAAAGMPGARLGAARLAALAADPALLIAIDGLNETREPAALVDAVIAPLRALHGGSVHVVITSHPEAAAVALGRVDPTWLAAGTGELRVHPLDDHDAAHLVGPGYDALALATRRWMRVPLIGLLARVNAGDAGADFSVDRLIESFVAAQTSDLERAVLRAIAARMLAAGRQALARRDYDDASAIAAALRECVEGEPPFGDAFAALVDRGLLTISGDPATRAGVSVAFAHDRILQWMAGRWLTAHPTRGEGDRGWAERFEALAPAPALALALGHALLHDDGSDRRIPTLTTSTAAADRAVARAAIEVASEDVPARATSLLGDAWHRARGQVLARSELVALAADLGEPGLLADALGEKDARDAATYALARVARHSTDTVATALGARWRRIERRPWLQIFATIRVLHALLYARFAEGSRPRDPRTLNELAATIVRRMVGTSSGRAAPVSRRVLFRLAAVAVRGVAAVVPQGPTKHIRELLHMFRQPPSARAWLRPLVEVFRGERRIDDAMDVVRRAASGREVGAGILLERALIAASRRPLEVDAALDAAVEAGALGCAASPPTMMGQGALYVLSSHLTRVPPSSPGWDARLSSFEAGLDRWLTAAPKRRWRSATGHWYKALFVSAHAQLHHRRHGTGKTARLERIWVDVIARADEQFAIDILDDLQILAVSRGMCALALEIVEPLLASSWHLPPRAQREALELLRAVHERAPDVVDDVLARGDEPVRRTLARELRMGRAARTAGYAIFLDFDDAFVLNEGLRNTIAYLFEGLLYIRRSTGFLDLVLRVAVNRVIGEPVFAEPSW